MYKWPSNMLYATIYTLAIKTSVMQRKNIEYMYFKNSKNELSEYIVDLKSFHLYIFNLFEISYPINKILYI